MVIDYTLAPSAIIRELGARFREYRLRMNLTQKEISDRTMISIPTIYKFERGLLTDMSIVTVMKLMRVIGLDSNWNQLVPELPESPYMYKKDKKKQRIRHSKT